MGPPVKPFAELSRTQQKRRIRMITERDLRSIWPSRNVVSNSALSSSSLTTARTPAINIVRYEDGTVADTVEEYITVETPDEDIQDESPADIEEHEEEIVDSPACWLTLHPETCCSSCREERRNFERTVLSKMNELIEYVRENGAQRKSSSPTKSKLSRTERRNFSLLPNFPINDLEELKRFDEGVRTNQEMHDQFRRKMAEIGGQNVQKATRYCMEIVMTNELSQQVNWTQGPEEKPKLSRFTFPEVIVDVVRDMFDGVSKKTVEARIADWLRRGGDRMKSARNSILKTEYNKHY